MPRGSRPEAQQGDGAGNMNSPETMDKPQEGQPDLRDLLLFMQQAQQDARRWQEEDARRKDEEARRWREEDARRREADAKCQAAWMEQLVSKLARGRVQEKPQPAQGEAPTSESMVEGGATDRRSTTTILEREETGSQADSRSGGLFRSAPGAARQPRQNFQSPIRPTPAQPPRPEAEVDDNWPPRTEDTS